MPRPKLEHHVLVCTNQRPPGHPKGCCSERGGIAVFQALSEARKRLGLHEKVRVNSTSCLGPCEHGANVVVYPDAVWYGGVTEDDVDEIVQEHLLGGRVVQRLVIPS